MNFLTTACERPETEASPSAGSGSLPGARARSADLKSGIRPSGFGLRLGLVLLLALTSWPAAAQSTNNAGPRRPDFSNFRIIPERNIFNPRRRGRIDITRRPVPPAEAFTLVGTMSFEKGQFAFFEGTRSEYQKVLKPADTIAGYTVTSIAPACVKLSSGSNDVQLRVGMQMRRPEQGTWEAVMADAPAPIPPSTSSTRPSFTTTNYLADGAAVTTNGEPAVIVVDANGMAVDAPPDAGSTNGVADASASTDDPVLKRLMQRREQEMNR